MLGRSPAGRVVWESSCTSRSNRSRSCASNVGEAHEAKTTLMSREQLDAIVRAAAAQDDEDDDEDDVRTTMFSKSDFGGDDDDDW